MSTTGNNDAVECTADEIMNMLRSQATLYARLESFASKQRGLVARDDAAPLLSLLADRQKLSVDLQRLAQRLEPVRRDWERHHARLTPGQRQEADSLLSDMRRRLERVMESDEQDARVLSSRKQAVAGALRETHVGGAALSAYRAAAPSRKIDRVDEAS